jgi:RimJ/RimL family protein N-acetyltransferase
MAELQTARLRLRQWHEDDLAPFAALNADPEVMRHFPAPLTPEESDALAHRERERIAERGWGLWAVEVLEQARFLGFAGLAEARFPAHFTPAVEVGWRLARDQWGNGDATEAAHAAVAFGFDELGLDEVVSFTTVTNERSRRVMERLGMAHDEADDFEHPRLPDGDPLRPHVLYRLRRSREGGARASRPRRLGAAPAARDRPHAISRRRTRPFPRSYDARNPRDLARGTQSETASGRDDFSIRARSGS